jgi:predicted transglutaminase-like cysteine proteinase
VRRRVVNRYPYVSDRERFGVEEAWRLPTKAGADCEDYALAMKMELQRDYGFPPQRLLLAVVGPLVNGVAHTVLVVHSDEGPLVLDSAERGPLAWKHYRRALAIQSAANPKEWM